MADFEAWLVFLILVVNVVGELQRKRTLAASRGFLAAARLSCYFLLFLLCFCVFNVFLLRQRFLFKKRSLKILSRNSRFEKHL